MKLGAIASYGLQKMRATFLAGPMNGSVMRAASTRPSASAATSEAGGISMYFEFRESPPFLSIHAWGPYCERLRKPLVPIVFPSRSFAVFSGELSGTMSEVIDAAELYSPVGATMVSGMPLLCETASETTFETPMSTDPPNTADAMAGPLEEKS